MCLELSSAMPTGRRRNGQQTAPLSCQSGTWTKTSGSGYTQNQLGKARSLEGTLSCGTSYPYPTSSSAHYAYFSASGQAYVRVVGNFYFGGCDSGWRAATSVTMTESSCGGYWGAYGSFNMTTTLNPSSGLGGSWSMPGYNGTFSCSSPWVKVYSILYGAED